MPLFCFFGASRVFFLIWGCPALWAGRAVSQLAGLLGPVALKRLGLPPLAALLPIPQPTARWAFFAQLKNSDPSSCICKKAQPPQGIL